MDTKPNAAKAIITSGLVAGTMDIIAAMLNFYINRGGKNLSASKKKILEDSKDELRKAFGREEKE